MSDLVTMTVKQRLIYFLKHKGIGQKAFARIVGLSDGYVNAIRVSIQPDSLHKISMHFPELNTGWLLTGEGSMLKSDDMPAEKNTPVSNDLTRALDIIASQQESLQKMSEAALLQAQTMAKLMDRLEIYPAQTSKAG